MMEKHGEIREGLTPPESPEQTEDKQAGLRQAAELMKETEARFSRLEEHMTKRSYTCITENLR
jgi:hypothetical protein|tara:strand:+ start:632 stop:820 length:189 start_codon:yes stop_codon:yes gene_type:complete